MRYKPRRRGHIVCDATDHIGSVTIMVYCKPSTINDKPRLSAVGSLLRQAGVKSRTKLPKLAKLHINCPLGIIKVPLHEARGPGGAKGNGDYSMSTPGGTFQCR